MRHVPRRYHPGTRIDHHCAKIFSCIARTDQRFGTGHIISVLRGENTQRIRDLRHNELSTYSLLADYAQPELRNFIYQLIGQGALAQENLVLANDRTVPILKLNQHSVDVMKGKRQVRLIQIVRKSTAEARTTRGQVISWEGVDEPLFEVLRGWRKEIAAKRGVPPYVIFADNTLREMARIRPTTSENLYLIAGIGQNKLKDFGALVLPIIKEHCKAHGISADITTPRHLELQDQPLLQPVWFSRHRAARPPATSKRANPLRRWPPPWAAPNPPSRNILSNISLRKNLIPSAHGFQNIFTNKSPLSPWKVILTASKPFSSSSMKKFPTSNCGWSSPISAPRARYRFSAQHMGNCD